MSRPPLALMTSAEVIARLEAIASSIAGPPAETLLAFDADGTLWSGDVGIDNFEALLATSAVLPAALPMLREEARGASLPISDDPTAQARMLYDAFLRDAYDEERAFRMMAAVFAGYREDDVRAFAAAVAGKTGLPERLHPEVRPILDWAARCQVPIYVVSASHALVVQSSLEFVGLPVAGLFAMKQALEDGLLTTRIVEPVTYGAGKTEALRAGVTGKTLLGAFGDSAFDLHLLRDAKLAVAVRPKDGLRARAAECTGLCELAVAP
ncbi:MAG: HAD family hydrolase [Polyangiaceae bacterium]